jgi:hypothetical protein
MWEGGGGGLHGRSQHGVRVQRTKPDGNHIRLPSSVHQNGMSLNAHVVDNLLTQAYTQAATVALEGGVVGGHLHGESFSPAVDIPPRMTSALHSMMVVPIRTSPGSNKLLGLLQVRDRGGRGVTGGGSRGLMSTRGGSHQQHSRQTQTQWRNQGAMLHMHVILSCPFLQMVNRDRQLLSLLTISPVS